MEKTQQDKLRNAIVLLEDHDLDAPTVRLTAYQTIEETLAESGHIDAETATRIMLQCTHDLTEELKYSANSLAVITLIVRKVQAGECSSAVNLVPSVLGILSLLKSLNCVQMRNKGEMDKLFYLCCDTLLCYPNKTLIVLIQNDFNKIKEFFDQSHHLTHRLISIIHKFLKILPPAERNEFVKRELTFWFTKLIPLAMKFVTINEDCAEIVETLETLTEQLVEIEYSSHPNWFHILECLSHPNRYPVIIKSMLEKKNDYWHRLWIIFIKLLKSQITKVCGTNGSPINSMLNAVECAFKMDAVNRCRAFECWKVLIDNFCAEANDLVVHKRVKLLIIPLRSNNTKIEVLACSKFETWWHLLRKFHRHIDQFADSLLIQYLYFCFGKHSQKDKGLTPPGQLSDKLKDLCVQSFIEILGHSDCDGCTTIPRMSNKVINTQLLISHWDDWMYSLKEVLLFLFQSEKVESVQQLNCIFKSLLAVLGELPASNVCKDLVDNLFNNWINSFKEGIDKPNTTKIILEVFIPTITDERYKKLLKIKDDKQSRLRNIVCEVLDLLLKVTERNDTNNFVQKAKPLVVFWITESKASNECVSHFVKNMLGDENSWAMWTLLADSVFDCASKSDPTIMTILLNWPLQAQNLKNIMTTISDVQYSASVWTNLYNTKPKINEMFFHDGLYAILQNDDIANTAHYFVTTVLLYVLKQKLSNNIKAGEVETKLLTNVLEKISDSQHFEKILPILIDTAVLMLNKLIEKEDKNFAATVITILKSILKLMVAEKSGHGNLTVFIQDLFALIETFFKKEVYSNMRNIILNDLINCYTNFTSLDVEKRLTATLLKLFLFQSKDSDPECHNKIKSVLVLDKTDNNVSTPTKANEKFVAPEKKPQKKKKEPNILNRVVENGEEYVVVKSNWKFNPRKLTENQKEKMKRKREDIPALYQDLSQSQDEFKLSTWKTDSQDTTTSSKSTSKTGDDDASSILKNIPSSEVVPKIIENLMSENKDSKEEKTDMKSINSVEAKTVNSPVTKPKTPRMALKDRVFRNVRNLMEKSRETNPSESAVVPSTESVVPRTPNNRVMSIMNIVNSASASKAMPEKQQYQKSDENIKTPTTKQKNISAIVNSAPAVLPGERPSRIKRKPKKFDDVQLIELKRKRRLSSSLNNSQSDSQVENEDVIDKTTFNEINDPPPRPEIAKPSLELISDPTLNTDFEENESVKVTEAKNIVDNICEVVNICVESHELAKKDVPKSDVEPKLSLDESRSLLTPIKNQIREIECQSNDDKLQTMHTPTTKTDELKQIEVTENYQDVELESSQCSQEVVAHVTQDENLQTPKANINKEKPASTKSSIKGKKSRIEKELAIDMVEGHPYLNTTAEKRVRKNIKEIVTPRRKNTKKVEKNKSETNTPKSESTKNKKSPNEEIITIEETQEKAKVASLELPCSEDVIESSQDSTATSISTKSNKSPKRIPVVTLERRLTLNENTQSLLDNFDNALIEHKSTRAKKRNESFDDSVIPCNKTAVADTTTEVTATMDTEAVEDKDSSDVIIVSEDIGPTVTIDTENTVDLNTEEIANADTQSINPIILNVTNDDINKNNDVTISLNTQEDVTKTFNERLDDDDSVSSPCKDKSKRKQDFLNNTIEISPIKRTSPLKEDTSVTSETSDSYVVIKLSSPVHSNGEPYEKCDSPEMFTEEKLSPDKRDLSPPRTSTTVTQLSPSSSLSLKKNRPQVRSGGRAAQMLGLCVTDNENSINTKKPTELEDNKNSTSTPARRNLRMIYNQSAENTEDNLDESDDNENILKLKKSLPPAGCSPSAPILKRKLAEITDDATISPVSKRKRVSFHDPPVSTTMSVIKYLEPCCARSPSNSATKRQERQSRSNSNMKSPKRLDNVFKLDTILTKAVESFSDNDTSIVSSNDTEMSSIEQTPIVEVIKYSDLNDTDPICPELVDCKDPISNIAVELSSPSMSTLLTKELKGKIECIGDLAKLTELEVNRLCIKVPKVAVAKKVLTDYLSKNVVHDVDLEGSFMNKKIQVDCDIQTDVVECVHAEMQTHTITTAVATVQCEACLASTSTQTNETGSKSTKDAILELKEKSDFVNNLTDILDDNTKLHIVDTLPFDSISTLLVSKLNSTTSKELLDRVIQGQTSPNTGNKSFLEDYISEKFSSKDLILLCSNLLRKAYDKPL